MRNSLLFFLFALSTVVLNAQDVAEYTGIYNFVPNGGQWPDGVLYKADVAGGKIWLEEKGILYQFVDNSNVHHADFDHKHNGEPELYQHLVFAQFLGANESFETKKSNPTKAYYNYFLGNDKSKWASGLHGYNKVEYSNLYNNIDLKFFEKDQDLKYEYHVKPGGDYKQIKVKYIGHSKIKKSKNGNVVIYNSIGQIIEQKPYVYQIKNGKIIEIVSEFNLSKDNILSFELGNYDQSIDLVIDPILVFATYNGAESDNFGMTATYAYDGSAYAGGTIYGNLYPTPAPAWNTTPNITVAGVSNSITTDVFISKYSADGTTMLWTNFIGGGDNNQGTETVHSLICDTLNNIYLYGATSSTDFPTQNAYQNSHNGGSQLQILFNGTNFGNVGTDIYVAKFSENGLNLIGSTYVGGAENDGVNYKVTSGSYNNVAFYDSLTYNYGDQFRGEIMLDSLNNVIIASCSRSSDFPILNSFQNGYGGQQDGVVFKLSSDFSNLLWSSYLGGTENDACYSVKIDSSYSILVAGGTSSNDLPGTVGGLNPNYLGGKTDGFVAKIVPDGSTIQQTTYIGTSTYDQTIFVEIDRWDNVYLVGQSDGNMPIINANYSDVNSGQFIMKLNPNLTEVIYSTVFGNSNGQPNISPAAFLVDVCGNVYVSGWGANILQGTGLTGMPVSTDAFQTESGDGFNFYLFVLERDAESMLYGSYIGDLNAQEHVDGGTSRFDKFGIVYQSVCGGCGGSSTFPTTDGAYSSENNSSNCNNLVFKFDFELVPKADFEVDNLDGCAPLTITFDNESNDTINSVWNFGPDANIISGGINPVVEFAEPGIYEVYLNITDTICNLQDTAKKVITVYNSIELEVSKDTIICPGATESFDLVANSFGSATEFIWATDTGFVDIVNMGDLDSVISVNPTESTTYYVTISNGWSLCDIMDSVQVHFLDDAVELMGDTSICFGSETVIYADVYSTSNQLNYEWTPGNQIIAANDSIAIINPNQSQYFTLTTSINGCSYSDSVFVQVDYINPDSVYAIANPEFVTEGGTATLQAFPDSIGYSYNWIPEFIVDNPTSQTTTATISENQEFLVQVNKGACTSIAKVVVNAYELICGDVYVFVPNAFTPNGDGNNDVVYVRGQNIEEMTFMIFDRWGELVFESTDQNNGWNGTYKGKPSDPDVFVYHLKVKCIDGQENLIKGNITLLR
jgi:gliding motility-associated-like protein